MTPIDGDTHRARGRAPRTGSRSLPALAAACLLALPAGVAAADHHLSQEAPQTAAAAPDEPSEEAASAPPETPEAERPHEIDVSAPGPDPTGVDPMGEDPMGADPIEAPPMAPDPAEADDAPIDDPEAFDGDHLS